MSVDTSSSPEVLLSMIRDRACPVHTYLRGNYSRIRPKVNQLLSSRLGLEVEILWQQRGADGNRKNRLSFSEMVKRLGISPEFQGEPDRQPYPSIVRTCASESGHRLFRMSMCTLKLGKFLLA